MRKALKLAAFVLLLASAGISLRAADYFARDFGAVPDGFTLNTVSIQAAIDFVSAHGGGRVVLDKGDYVAGSIYLKNDVTLWIDEDSALLGSLNPFDYIKDPDAKWTALVFAIGQKNIGIEGGGTINGRGFDIATRFIDFVHLGVFEDPLGNDRLQEAKRPENIHFYKCEGIVIRDLLLKDPGCWNQQYDKCRDILVERVHVDAKSYWNNDGIDIVDSSDVIIRDCFFDAADDVYCFKSHSTDGVSENILVENCIGRSSANGIKFGTYTRGKFKNFKFKNMKIYDTYRSAITIATVDGATIEDVEIDGVESIHTGNPIFLRTGTRHTRDDQVPYLKNIVIKNMYAEVPLDKPDAGYSYEGPVEDLPRNVLPSIIYGNPNIKIENVRLENIEIVYPGHADPEYAYRGSSKEELDAIPEMETSYPEFSNWKELPAWGFYIRHADGIVFDNVKITVDGEDYRPAIVTDDVNGLRLKDVEINQDTAEKGKKQIITKDTKNIKKK
ncbi:MAG: glycoside hydrolase [Bacteroidales bacterium]|nr:glycoside hydrolase [Bacteroidales bacterium]